MIERACESNSVHVWLITVGEPLPTDPGEMRLLRTGIVASLLASRGHTVRWWTSQFDHQRKSLRATPASLPALPGLTIELLRGDSYDSNVSLARIRNHRQGAADFARRARIATPPSVIVCAYPTVELADAAVAYAREHRIPILLDIRDLWPDIFLNLAPGPLRPLGRLALAPMFVASRRACAGATAIYGITESFVEWGVKRAGRQRRKHDRAFPLAYRAVRPSAAELAAARAEWDNNQVMPSGKTLCFFGTLGRQFDILAVLDAARHLNDPGVKFVICGAGDRLAEYQRAAADLPNVIFSGWVSAAAIWALMERSIAGLAPYYSEKSFTMSVPNKAIEYLAGGLPILSSLSGELASLLERERCGWTWDGSRGLAQAIRRLLENPHEQGAMAENARRTYEQFFVAETVYAEMIDHILELGRATD